MRAWYRLVGDEPNPAPGLAPGDVVIVASHDERERHGWTDMGLTEDQIEKIVGPRLDEAE